jgi:hypothetical protein
VGGRPDTYAHTSPVWAEVGGEPVAVAADAQWCLDWLASLAALVREHGSFASPGDRDAVLGLVSTAAEVYREIADRSTG